MRVRHKLIILVLTDSLSSYPGNRFVNYFNLDPAILGLEFREVEIYVG